VTELDAGAPQDAAPSRDASTCPWCAAHVAPDGTRCPACGAALAQRETIGDLRIPGLTSVDPALEDFDKRPLHIPGPSPSHGFSPTLAAGMIAGGPVGVMAFGGAAAIIGAELAASLRIGPDARELEDVGRPSQAVLQALERGADGAAEPGPAGSSGPDGASNPAAEPDAAADDGRSIWRDLPPESEEQDSPAP
jgi:hypothetical protein